MLDKYEIFLSIALAAKYVNQEYIVSPAKSQEILT